MNANIFSRKIRYHLKAIRLGLILQTKLNKEKFTFMLNRIQKVHDLIS